MSNCQQTKEKVFLAIQGIGLDEKSILKYVRWQKTQDLGQAKLELF